MTLGVSQSKPNPITEQMEREKKTPKEGNGLGLSYPAPKSRREEYRYPHPEDSVKHLLSFPIFSLQFFFSLQFIWWNHGVLCVVCPSLDFANGIPVVWLTCFLKMELSEYKKKKKWIYY